MKYLGKCYCAVVSLLMVSDDLKKVSNKLNNLRKTIENLVIEVDSKEIKITISIGFTIKNVNESIDIAFDRADKELYDAKKCGRNRVKFRV